MLAVELDDAAALLLLLESFELESLEFDSLVVVADEEELSDADDESLVAPDEVDEMFDRLSVL